MTEILENTIKILIISLFFFGGVFLVRADSTALFNNNLYWNMSVGSPEVKLLQEFLVGQGLYSGDITGNFLSQTYKAVKQFQIIKGVTPSGYFGPITRAKANEIILNQSKSIQEVSTVESPVPPAITSTGNVGVIGSLQARVSSLFEEVWSLQRKIRQKYGSGRVSTSASTSTPTPVPTPAPTPAVPQTTTPSPVSVVSSPLPPIAVATTPSPSNVLWGAYVGDNSSDILSFETLVGKPVDIVAVFYAFSDSFPKSYSETVGAKGKTLLIFWEPSFGYDTINNGSQDNVIKKFAADAKSYGYPVILAPFHEMNGNWDVWDGTVGNNSPAKFITGWRHVHDLFVGVNNVKFAIAYNNDSVPDVSGNQISDYYPGDDYVDYVGVDGFNFGNPWKSFQSIFSSSLAKLSTYNKPIYIFSMGSVPGTLKASWITDALDVQVRKYPIAGWVWFNQNGRDGNWIVNSDISSLAAFKSVLP